ncbi:MAG: 50S ribosomal protein L18 [Firmicutes bacterium HGW-Firmicutes-7]|nr:MAG: 50S ribosomal protein L18 [Firmicutes bacterium HGW-Firmicutes-7]
MVNKEVRSKVRVGKHRKIRNKIKGTSERPRLCVFRSNSHIYAQIIDDSKGITLVAASTMDKDFQLEKKNDVEAAKVVGNSIAKKAVDKGINTVVFDRGGYIYHGKVQALADAAREVGLIF